MYSEYKSQSLEMPREADNWGLSITRAIDLAIASGLFLAPRRVLLEMAETLKHESEKAVAGGMELPRAA